MSIPTALEMLQGRFLGSSLAPQTNLSPFGRLLHPELYGVGPLGVPPGVTTANTGPVVSPGSAPVATTGETADLAENTCTSDGKMVWSAGAWRVVTDKGGTTCDVTTPTRTAWTDVVSTTLESAGHQYYVGPFQIPAWMLLNPTDDAAIVMNMIEPSQLPHAWIPKIRDMLDVAATAMGFSGGTAPYAAMDSLPWLAFPSPSDPLCTAGPYPKHPGRCAGGYPDRWDGQTYTDQFGEILTHGLDDHGFPVTLVQHPYGLDPNDQNTYKVYSPADWSLALGLNERQMNALGGVGRALCKSGMITWEGSVIDGTNMNLPPIAKWIHPRTGETWGLWLTLTNLEGARKQDCQPYNTFQTTWDSSADRADTAVLQIGFGKIPDAPWWASVLEALLWVPTHLLEWAGDAIGDTLNALLDLACSDVAQLQAMINADKNVAQRVAAQGGLAAMHALCPKPGQPVVPPPQKPIVPTWVWWVGGALVLGVLIVATSPKKRERERERIAA